MAGKKWTESENKILIKRWKNCPKIDILKLLPNRTWAAAIIQAAKLGLKRDIFSPAVSQNKNMSFRGRLSNFHRILDQSYEAYYWAGFIVADGSVSDLNRITLTLAQKDRSHLLKFAKFINLKNVRDGKSYSRGKEFKNASISVMDKMVVSEFKTKFDIRKSKTYNPPTNLNIYDDDFFISFLIGYIDGDGSIRNQTARKDSIIRIKCHSSWQLILNNWLNRLYRIAGANRLSKTKINKQGYASVSCGNKTVVEFLKRKTKSLGLPAMRRKWDLI
jgi:DNA-binding transcriptional regulator WhiA